MSDLLTANTSVRTLTWSGTIAEAFDTFYDEMNAHLQWMCDELKIDAECLGTENGDITTCVLDDVLEELFWAGLTADEIVQDLFDAPYAEIVDEEEA